MNKNKDNILAKESIGKLILKFSIPAIISGLVNTLYNIIDQIFIGRGVGILGNAATNVAFPIVTISTALSLLIGVGTASNFNLKLGEGKEKEAKSIVGNGIGLLSVLGIILAVIILLFLEPLINFFGATEEVLPYAMSYAGITAIGIPFVILGTGGSHLIRADGSPIYSMVSILVGAIINMILDPIFIFTFDMGIEGAAWATVIGQVISSIIVIRYFFKFKTIKIESIDLKPKFSNFKLIASLGAAASINQLAMTIVQIVMNNTLTHYGAMSKYGSEIPLAVVGIVSKINVIYIAIIIGIAQGCQPIYGYNYGAKNFTRVKDTYKRAISIASIISIIAFLIFQIFPMEIMSIFGNGNELYLEFAIKYFRIYLMMTFINGIQPITSIFFSSIGRPKLGIILSLTRQVILLLPLIVLLPRFLGIDGVMYAGPIADGVALIVVLSLLYREMKRITILEQKYN